MMAAAAAVADPGEGRGSVVGGYAGSRGPAPPRLGEGIRRGESGASTAGGTSPSVRLPPPPPTRMLRRSKHEMTAVAGRRADASHRTNERSLSPPTAARFLSWRICWGWVLIKSHGPIIHLLLHVRFHPRRMTQSSPLSAFGVGGGMGVCFSPVE
jgi:hypothetical protein